MMAGNVDTAAILDDAAPVPETTAATRVWRAAWRQHRAWILGTLALLAAGAVILPIINAVIPACSSTNWWETPGATCNTKPAQVVWGLYRLSMLILPILAGALLGALTFGPDLEHRTHIYALTQGVSRTRWWVAKVVITTAPICVATVLLGLGVLWAVSTADDTVMYENRLTTPGFDIMGLVPATRFLLAYAAASLAVLVWRTIGGLVTGIAVAALLAFGTGLLQPHVVAHQRDLIPIDQWIATDYGSDLSGSAYSISSAYQWGTYTDADGRELDPFAFNCDVDAWDECIKDNGVVYRLETYVPDSEYTQMMLVISGINLVGAAGMLGLGALRLRRHDL